MSGFIRNNFIMSLNPVKVVKAEEAEEEAELVDPQQKLRESCNEDAKITNLRERYQGCNDRVNSRSRTAEICSEELFDYLHAVDNCVTKTLFSHLK
ncbi:hypothetical protein B566_EDAN000751 [Ephemera danica]|nr:hypothetical protein B566_EDAN000751 [Ephemera danica]